MDKMLEKKLLYWSSFIIGALANFNVVLIPFFYYAKDMNDGQVAILLSATYLSALFMPVFGYISDTIIGPREMLKKICVLVIIVSVFLFISNSFIMLFIFSIFFTMFRSVTYPLIDNLTLAFCKQNNFVYGSLRKGASYGFAFGILLAMPILLILDIVYVILFPIILCVVLLIVLSKIEFDIKIPDRKISVYEYKNNVMELLKSNRFLVLLAINLCVLGISDLKLSYQSSLLDGLNAPVVYIVALNIASAFFELVLMSKTEKFFEKHHISFLLIIVVSLSIVQNIVLFMSSSLFLIIIAASLHGLAMSIYIPNFFSYMSKVIPEKSSSTGYIINSTIQSLSTFVVNSIFIAPLVVQYNIRASFIIIALIILLSLIPCFVLFRIDKLK